MYQRNSSLQRAWSATFSRFLLSITLLAGLSSLHPGTAVFGSTINRQQPAGSSTTPVLELNKSIERTLTGTEVHSYQVVLLKDQFAEVAVDQIGIDIAVWFYDPKGNKFSEVDAFRPGERETVVVLADVPGPYRLELHPTFPKAPAGSYKITLTKFHDATEQEKNAVAGGVLIANGLQIERAGTAEAFREAIEKYQKSIPLWRAAKDAAWEANALYLIANDYINLGNKDKAMDYATQAVTLAQTPTKETDEEKKLQAAKVEAWALDVLGKVHSEFGDKKKALDYFNQALAKRKQVGERSGEVNTLNNIAMTYKYMGESQKALNVYEASDAILNELGDQPKRFNVLNNMCVLYDDLGEYKKGRTYCERALALSNDLKDLRSTATVLNNIGNSHTSLGEYQQGLDFYNESYEIYRKLEHRQGQAIELNNIGWVYATLGEYERAIEFYNKSLDIFRADGDQYRMANVMNNIAVNYATLQQFRKALEMHQQVLAIRKAVNTVDGEAVSLNNIANTYKKLGEPEKAREYFKQSIELLRQRDPRQLSVTLRNLGSLYQEAGDLQNAQATLNESLQISKRISDRVGEAATVAQLAQVERDRGNLTEAKRLIDSAITSVESLRINLKSHQLRASYSASVRKYHEWNIDILMRLHKANPDGGFAAAALVASENGRARSLVELLTESIAGIHKDVDPTLVERELALRQSISVTAERQMRLLSASHTEAEAATKAQELDALTAEYEAVQTKIRQTSPRYAALTHPEPVSLKKIQGELLDQDTVLLEYSIGEEKSFLWAVTSNSLHVYELPKRSEIENLARSVYDLIVLQDRPVANETLELRQKRLDQADAEFPEAAAKLSEVLLAPAASELIHKRLLIVSEGVLQYVPFAALPEPQTGKVSQTNPLNNNSPLVVNHEITNLPSASVLAVLREESGKRSPATKTIAAFADPVFEANDPRLAKNGEISKVSYSEDVRRSAEESGLANFQRLRFSREEANQIMKLVPRNNSMEALDFSANHAAATDTALKQYRILHFATHGIVNSRHPELSGIVLSLVDKDGKPANGFLRLYDIYNMNLTADLVVLSACQTALGKDIKGEGLIGLTRAFMYAGSTRVVASLWQTEDRATAVLMGHFYQGLFSNKLSAPAALRNAQLAMLQNKRWQKPRYWAAFTIQGEWK